MYSVTILFLGLLPTALLFFFSKFGRHNQELNPFQVLGWVLLLGYSLKSVYLAYAVAYGAPFRTEFLSRDIIHIGQIAVCVGVAAFLFGYVLMDGNPISVKRRKAQLRNPEPLYYTVFAFSFGLMAIYFYQMGFLEQLANLRFVASKFFIDEEGGKSSLAFLTIGGDFLMVYFLFYVCFSDKLRLTSPMTVAIIFISLIYMLASRRNGVMIIMAATMMVVGVRAGANTVRARTMRNSIILAAVVLLAFVGAIRKGGGEKGLEDLQLADAFQVSVEHTFEGAYFLDPAKTAAAIDQTESRNLWLNGASFAAFVIAPIPRVLWEDKPLVRIGPYVGQEILQYDNDSGAPPGGVAEFYINFGWGGIIVGMMLLGGLTALAYRRYLGSDDRRFGRVQYVFALICLALFLFADFSLAILYLIRFTVAAWICRQFWYKYAEPRPRVAKQVAMHQPSGLPRVEVARAP